MLEKFHDMSDDDIVFAYKKTKQEDLEIEIISRYQKHSKILAGSLYSKFKFLYQVEFDDLYCILLSSLFTSIRGFTTEMTDFYHYWKSTATNEAQSYIGKFSQFNNELIVKSPLPIDDVLSSGYLRQKSDSFKDDLLLKFDLEEFLKSPNNKLDEVDVNMFRLYLNGYSITEIAKLIKTKYHIVRYRIDRVRARIANILFNQ